MSTEAGGRHIKCPICGHEAEVFRDKESEPGYCRICDFPLRENSAVPLADINLEKFIDQTDKLLIIVFWAPYDAVCRDFMPLFDEVASRIKDGGIFITVDVSTNPEMKRRFGIQLLPTLVVFKHGKERNRIIGTLGRYELEQLVSGGAL